MNDLRENVDAEMDSPVSEVAFPRHLSAQVDQNWPFPRVDVWLDSMAATLLDGSADIGRIHCRVPFRTEYTALPQFDHSEQNRIARDFFGRARDHQRAAMAQRGKHLRQRP